MMKGSHFDLKYKNDENSLQYTSSGIQKLLRENMKRLQIMPKEYIRN